MKERYAMPFLHLDSYNKFKEEWIELVKNHSSHFEVLEWTTEQDRDLLFRSQPALDTQLFSKSCISVVAGLQKLVNYGGIVVQGQCIVPTRGLRILLNDWKTLGPPRKFTVRGYAYPILIDRSTIMASKPGDALCRSYLDNLVQGMLLGRWENPVFQDDVAIM